jgi:HSP20 family molecular chaperone IbpA
MGAVVWDTVLDSIIPTQHTLGDLNPLPSSNQHHHHYHYPGGVYHSLSNIASGFGHQKTSSGELVSWTPDCDVRETKKAYYIDIEAPGISDKKAIQISWLSGRVLQIDGVTTRSLLEGDGEPTVKSSTASNGISKDTKVKMKADEEDVPCEKCASQGFGANSTTNIIRGERKIGSWRRHLTLPVGCDLTSLKAKLDAGLLQITVTKNEGFPPEGARNIEIE